jgi:hypothetical protein
MLIAQSLMFFILFSTAGRSLTFSLLSKDQEPKQEKHFKVEALFPDGSQISRGANILHRPSDGNSTSYVFDAPYDKIWAAVHRVSEELTRIGQYPLRDEKEGILTNSNFDSVLKSQLGVVRGAWISDLRTEALAVSKDKTKVKITRRVWEYLNTQWIPSNSNGRVERWMLTRIEDELRTPSPAPEASPLLGPPSTAERLTNSDIIKLVKAGIPDELIANKIRKTNSCNFDTRTEGLVELKRGGVSSGLIQFIMEYPCPANGSKKNP